MGGSEADPKVELGGPLKARATPKLWTNINTMACGAGCHRDGRKTECSAGGDKGREGSGIMGRWRLKSFCKLPPQRHSTLFV